MLHISAGSGYCFLYFTVSKCPCSPLVCAGYFVAFGTSDKRTPTLTHSTWSVTVVIMEWLDTSRNVSMVVTTSNAQWPANTHCIPYEVKCTCMKSKS